MTIDFTVHGTTVDDLRASADAVMAQVAPGRAFVYLSFDARSFAESLDGGIRMWEGRVTARVPHGADDSAGADE